MVQTLEYSEVILSLFQLAVLTVLWGIYVEIRKIADHFDNK